MQRLHAVLAALGLAGLVSLVIALTALASPGPDRTVPGPAAAPAHSAPAHALATRVVVRRRVVRRCRRVVVRRDGRVLRRDGRVVRRRVCRRVVVRVRVRVPVPATTAPAGTVAAPPAPPAATTSPATVTAPTTTGTATVTAPAEPPTLEVRVAAGFDWPRALPAVPAGPVRLRFRNDSGLTHGLAVRRTDGAGGTTVVVAPGGAGTSGEQTLTLAPGTHQVFCPVPGHVGQGMTVTLTVV